MASRRTALHVSFNTQPRGGGCLSSMDVTASYTGFNTQPRGGGCGRYSAHYGSQSVSTHSRAEAAALKDKKIMENLTVSTHSRAEAAAFCENITNRDKRVSTHSRAEAAAQSFLTSFIV